ncbi:MAG: universal stress protein [Balneolaceae bacterium]|nr:MAG: universal stress protein [Balneolaceae bacterium]
MKSTFVHAIVALDQSEASDLIIETLPHFKKLGTKKVTLVTVVSVPFTGERTEFNTKPYYQKLKAYRKQLEEHDFVVEIDLRSGTYFYPPTEILASADEHDGDFVIISNRGQSKVQEMLLGSTASEVLQRSRIPVYLINIDMEADDENPNERRLVITKSVEKTLNHVMHATDFSDTANRAFDVIRDLDSEGKIDKFSFVHVQGHHAIALKDPASFDTLTAKSQEQLEDMRNSLSDKTRNNSEIIITFGTPGKEIISAIEDSGATLVVMGSQGKGFVHEFFLGGVSSQVTRFSKVPVLLVPAERD